MYRGPDFDDVDGDNEDPEFPANVRRLFPRDSFDALLQPEHRIFADFEVCPLAQERPGVMQAACIESAKNIVVER